MSTTKRNYRKLRIGEMILPGDLYQDTDKRWKRTIWANFREGGAFAQGYPHKRRVKS